jgi:hypothetical protein
MVGRPVGAYVKGQEEGEEKPCPAAEAAAAAAAGARAGVMEGTSGADVLNKQYNVIRMVSMTCLEGTVHQFPVPTCRLF